MSRKKIAIVSHQYGENICGGAEFHARILAEHLTAYFEVTVLTSESLDSTTDKHKKGLTLKRFPVKDTLFHRVINRKSKGALWIKLLLKLGFIILNKKAAYKVLERSLYTPDLLRFLSKHKNDFDVVIFFSYLFYPTFFGMKLVKEKAILIPLAHDEPTFYKTPKKLFSTPALTLFNTQVEKELVQQKISISENKCSVVGCGIDETISLDNKTPYPKPYLLYVGRIVKMKGADLLINHFIQFVKEHPKYGLKLLLLGNKKLKIPDHEDVVYMGFTPEKEKFQYLNNALALVNPSYLESLSLVVLESFFVETPVIVNGECNVLQKHIEKSNAGFAFKNYTDFERAVLTLLNNGRSYQKMAQNGKNYYQKKYSWKVVEKKIVAHIHTLINTNES
ncbi:MAG: glycosyltransferase family 4 protein [Flavobacteriaceae bacterium]